MEESGRIVNRSSQLFQSFLPFYYRLTRSLECPTKIQMFYLFGEENIYAEKLLFGEKSCLTLFSVLIYVAIFFLQVS